MINFYFLKILRITEKFECIFKAEKNIIIEMSYIFTFSYLFVVEKVFILGQIFDVQILMDFHVLKSFEFENHIFSSWSVCMCVRERENVINTAQEYMVTRS